jgi:nucleotide-binding universal stress UspA family protein
MNIKKILIATDFSPAAHSAVLYGIQLAKAMKAHAILFSACHVEHTSPASNPKVSHLALMEKTKKRLADEADDLIKGHDTQLEIVCKEGSPHEAILAIAKEKGVDLIIVGMKGSGKDSKKMFNSTTSGLVNNLRIPTLLVPDGNSFTIPKNILFASDVFLDTAISSIDQVKWLTEFFKSKLFVVRVVKDSYEEVRENVNTPHNLRRELKTLNTSFSFPVNKKVTDGLNEFVSEQRVDLIIMMPRKDEWLESLFVKTKTKDMVFHWHVPVLILSDTKITNTDAVQTMDNYSHKIDRSR